MNKSEISIIITAHHEGLFLQKTILSILESAKSLEKSVKYEILLNLDNPDSETRRVANLWSENPLFIISEVSFGNPADNRNDAIKKSQGKFITLLDGDDLVSSNWLKSAYDLAKRQDGNFIIRPEIHMQFGYEEEFNTIWHMRNSRSKQEDAIQMAYWNLWTNSIFTTKETLLKIPYQNPKNGFGFEDYLFGADTRAQGTPNIIAPETVLFYRRRSFSMTTLHKDTILDYTDLLNIDFMKSIPLSTEEIRTSSAKQSLRNGFKQVYRFGFDSAKKSKTLNKALSPMARNMLYKNKIQRVPDWLIREWKAINKIENQLWPTKGEIAKLGFHPLTLKTNKH
jgi:glycosyltransferase involved in cell wall biosynthesis